MAKNDRSGQYIRNGKVIKITWGGKISSSLKKPEVIAKRRSLMNCINCGKEINGLKQQRTCSHDCSLRERNKNPFVRKVWSISANLIMGKGKKVIISKLLLESLGKSCKYCGEILVLENSSLDHKVPFMNSEYRRQKIKFLELRKKLDRIENLQVICRKCNGLKGNFSDEQYTRLLDWLKLNPDIGTLLFSRLKMGMLIWKK